MMDVQKSIEEILRLVKENDQLRKSNVQFNQKLKEEEERFFNVVQSYEQKLDSLKTNLQYQITKTNAFHSSEMSKMSSDFQQKEFTFESQLKN